MSKAKEFLKEKMREDNKLIGPIDESVLEKIAQAWMNDKSNSKHRFDVIKEELPKAKKILDMASGAGTFSYYGLLNGYDVYGIEPEDWKHKFIEIKSREYDYPLEWNQKFKKGYGEKLPFENDNFDVVSSYQTLEHVQDVKKCISEMIRTVKSGGGVHMMCPDYRGTYEGHYMMAWLPLFPRKIANIYLKIRGRNPEYLKTLTYTTSTKIYKYIKEVEDEQNIKVQIIDLNKKIFEKKLYEKNIFFLKKLYFIYRIVQYIKKLFKSEININYFVKVNKDIE